MTIKRNASIMTADINITERVEYVTSSLLLQNRSLCRCTIVLDGTQLEHWEYHKANAIALGNVLLASSYDALISECL